MKYQLNKIMKYQLHGPDDIPQLEDYTEYDCDYMLDVGTEFFYKDKVWIVDKYIYIMIPINEDNCRIEPVAICKPVET